jgi:hypothetical protein
VNTFAELMQERVGRGKEKRGGECLPVDALTGEPLAAGPQQAAPSAQHDGHQLCGARAQAQG